MAIVPTVPQSWQKQMGLAYKALQRRTNQQMWKANTMKIISKMSENLIEIGLIDRSNRSLMSKLLLIALLITITLSHGHWSREKAEPKGLK